MADKLRSVNTKFWEDSFIESLTPSEKLLFIYLLTNTQTNMLGIYEITIKRIKYDTGLNDETISKAFERFGTVKKIFYKDNFIIMPNFLKHQHLNSNMKIGVAKLFNDLPNELKNSILSNGSETIPNDYSTIRNGLLKYEIEIESEIESEIPNDKISFDIFWELYDKKIDAKKSKLKWDKLSLAIQKKIIEYIPKYKLAYPDKQYRKNPETFFNNQSWENELLNFKEEQVDNFCGFKDGKWYVNGFEETEERYKGWKIGNDIAQSKKS